MEDATIQERDAEVKRINGRQARAEREAERLRKQFGRNLGALMKEKGITQVALSSKTGLSVSYISMLTGGKREATLFTSALLAQSLGTTREELYAAREKGE